MTTRTKRMSATAQVESLFSTDSDQLKQLVKQALEEILEGEMAQALGAERGERTGTRLGYRSGHYTRGLVTRIGKLELAVTNIVLSINSLAFMPLMGFSLGTSTLVGQALGPG